MTAFGIAFDNYNPRQVPSLRYPQFITAFEKEVSIAQERIKNIETMEYPYNVIREVWTRINLPNDIEITFSDCGMNIALQAIPSDSMKILNSLVTAIGQDLVKADIHKSGLPSCHDGGMWHTMNRRWYGKNPKHPTMSCVINLDIDIPEEGLTDLIVERIPYSYTTTRYEYKMTPRAIAATLNDIKEMTDKFQFKEFNYERTE